jgi:Flp pilus assembly protein TadD
MTLAQLADRGAATAFMLVAGVLLAWRMPARRARIAWIVLIVSSLAYDLALNLQPVNFPNSNFDHYYLGAKYPLPYAETYRLIHAGEGRAQIGMRDLERPAEVVRSGTVEQRAYYIDLLRSAHVPFEPLAALDTLADRARDSGVIEAEARRILASRLPADRVGAYRRDVRAVLSMGQGPHLTLDYGYNGSPFYGVLRQLDPTLHLPFSRLSALAGLAWQLLGVALIAWLSGIVLGLSSVERLAVGGLILACSEFARYAMSGLVFTELWVAVVFALWALHARRPALSGVAMAFAGMLKLFPFALVAAAALPGLRSFGPGESEPGVPALRRRALVLAASCAGAGLGWGLLGLASGRSWVDFAHKISVEFQAGSNMVNSVSAAAALATLGVPEGSPLPWLVSLAALLPLLALFWQRPNATAEDALARRALVLVASLGWLLKSWLNYYAIVPFLLLPLLARRHRLTAAAMAAGMAFAYLLPEFDDPELVQNPPLHFLKLVPYLAVPAWLVWLELQPEHWPRRFVRGAALAAALIVAGIGFESWRGGEMRRLAEAGESALASSNATLALDRYERLTRLMPRDARTQRKRAIALATLGRMDEALAGFARAVALAPGDAAAHDDYGRALLMSGRSDEAARQLETANRLDPTDVQVLYQLARLRLAAGRRAEAVALLSRARELAPEEPTIGTALEEIGAH